MLHRIFSGCWLTVIFALATPCMAQETKPKQVELLGKVVDQNGKPVANAQVSGIYAARAVRRRAPNLKTDDNGTFRVERSLHPLVLYVRSAEKSLAGVARSDAEATEVTVTLAPVTSASGKLHDHNGQVIADKELPYGIRVFMAEPGRSAWTDTFGGKVKTNTNGEFTLSNLVVGETYQLNYYFNDTSSLTVTKIDVKDPKPIALGDLQIDTSPPESYTPPTPAQKTKDAFTGKRDIVPETRLTNLLAEAKREYTRPLLLIGTPDDKACIDLFRLFDVRERAKAGEKKDDYQAPNELRWEFELASLDRLHPPILEFLKTKKLDQGEQPLLAMLDANGQVVDTLPLKLEGDKLNPRAIGAWMEKYKLPTRNAVQMYEAATAKAQADDKRVFLIFSASWCGPCRMLARFLAPHKEELDKHFVFVKFDVSRDANIDELHDRYPDSNKGGVPWFCILDAKNKILVDSNVPKDGKATPETNMGFPTMPEEIKHFVLMLKTGAPRLPAEKLQEYEAELMKKK
jgi:thiol-disulfide isomerase/thioredoxin